MKIKKRVIKKILAAFSAFILLVSSFAPYLLILPEFSQVKAQEVVEAIIIAEETVTPTPIVIVTPTIEETPVETVAPTEIPTLEPTEASTKLVVSLWQSNSDGSETTANIVSLNQTYQAPQNDKVTVTFTKLPDNSGKLTIKEVKLSAEQQADIGAFSDTAYDITSDMADGTFTYNLTLPVPEVAKGKTIEVKSGETVDEVTNNGEIVDQPKEIKSETITITGLDHFTVFVLVPPTTTGVTNGVVAVTDDAFIKEDNTGSNNNGNDIQIESKSTNKDWRGLIKFDLSSIPSGSTVFGATLKLTLTSAPNSPRQHDVHKVTAGWNEGTVTWTSINSNFTASPTDSANTGTTNNQIISWDVTADVNTFLAAPASNYGWMIMDSVEEGITNNDYLAKYASSENDTNSKRPQLSITFDQTNVAGFHNPTAQANVTSLSGDNNGYQTDPTAAFGSDNTYGEDPNSGSNNNSTCASIGADRHLYYNYDLDTQIPAGSVIDGLEIRQDLSVDSLADNPFTCVELSWDGGTNWTSVEHKQTLSATGETTYTFGGSSDKWGQTWSKINLTNDNFRVRVINGDTDSGSNNSSRDFNLDWIPARVYYTPDTTEPTDPTPSSASHTASSWNSDTTVDVTWSGASDPGGSGIDGFYTEWNTSATNMAGPVVKEYEETADAETSPSLSTGQDHYFHIATLDNAGNWTSTAHLGPFWIDANDPVVSLDSPTNGSLLSGSVLLQASASDVGSDLNPLEFSYQKSTDIGFTSLNIDTSAPYEFNWNTAGVSDGDYTLRAAVSDGSGRISWNDIDVTIDNTDPTTPDAPTTTSPTSNNIPTWDWTASADTNLDYYIFFWDTILGGEANNSGNILNNFFTNPLALSDGTWYGKVKAYDVANNSSAFSNNGSVLIDTIAPSTPTATNPAGDYTSDQSVTLDSSDAGSGLKYIYYTTDGSTPDITKTLYSTPITVDKDMMIKAIAYDNADNASDMLTADYGIAPKISSETSSSVTSTTTTITWTTDDLATSRVIYDTVSHLVLEAAPNYDYGNSTIEADNDPMVISHSVSLSGLTAGTTYYYRTVSHGSPEAVGDEQSFTTDTSSGGGGGTVLGAASAPVCNDTKPGSAPTLLSAIAGFNSVTLTWSKAANPVSYYLMTFGTSAGAQTYGNPNVGGADATSYTVNGLSGGSTYYFKVRAGNGCAPGDFSNELFSTPTGGFIEGVPAGFEAGVLGETTNSEESEELTGESTPTGTALGLQTKNDITNSWWWPWILLSLLPLGWVVYKKWKK